MPIENIVFSNVRIQAAKGFTCTNAKGVVFDDVVIDTDAGPALIKKNSTEIETSRLRTNHLHEGTPLTQAND